MVLPSRGTQGPSAKQAARLSCSLRPEVSPEPEVLLFLEMIVELEKPVKRYIDHLLSPGASAA